MCGIAGIYAYHYAANAVDRAELRRIRDHMAARGPDGLGEWYSQDERVGLGHRRLTIIDLSERGAQPMASADGKLVVTFNGEIYNYRQLRASLEAKGCMFRTQTDTEVLLHLYAEKGEAMVKDLRGMFAFALWDAEKSALLLARDPYGIKPLYYADDGWTLPLCIPGQGAVGRRQKSRAIRNPPVGLDSVCSAAFPNRLRPIRKSALCQRVRHFGWIASALARQSSIFPSPRRTAARRLRCSPVSDEDRQHAVRGRRFSTACAIISWPMSRLAHSFPAGSIPARWSV